MYYYLNGTLVATDLNSAVVDCGGVGYRATISSNTLGHLAGKTGEKVTLYTHLAVREDGIELFGFSDLAEKQAFLMLLDVSGVGPKVAIAVLSLFTPDALCAAVIAEDQKAIAKASGVGQKTAARIILELKDKIAKQLPVGASASYDDAPTASAVSGGLIADAVNSLLVLGYSRAEANAALRGVDTEKGDLEDIIRQALRRLAMQ